MAEKTITSYFQEDHDRLDKLFDQFQALKACDYPEAKRNFKEFKFGLQRHIVWEEDILFPFFETKTGSPKDAGPTAVMRFEHRLIKEALELLHRKVQKEDSDSDEEETKLLSSLSEHNRKEETILYPMIDRFASEEERKQIFKQMENIPEEQYRSCCNIHHHS